MARRRTLPGIAVAAMAAMPFIAFAQSPSPSANAGISSQSLPAPDVPSGNQPLPGTAKPSKSGKKTSGTQSGQAGQNGQATSPPARMPKRPNLWDKRKTAVLAILNKVDGTVSRVNVPVGGELTRDKLHIKVEACLVRPKSMAKDAAVFLDVTGPASDAPSAGSFGASKVATQSDGEDRLFRGWLVQSEPGATVVGNAAVTFQILNCTGK